MTRLRRCSATCAWPWAHDAERALLKEESFYRELHQGYIRHFEALGAAAGSVGIAARPRARSAQLAGTRRSTTSSCARSRMRTPSRSARVAARRVTAPGRVGASVVVGQDSAPHGVRPAIHRATPPSSTTAREQTPADTTRRYYMAQRQEAGTPCPQARRTLHGGHVFVGDAAPPLDPDRRWRCPRSPDRRRRVLGPSTVRVLANVDTQRRHHRLPALRRGIGAQPAHLQLDRS